MSDLSIIIVNWNTKDILLKCLESIKTHLKALSYEIILIDNGSTDGSVESVKESRFSGMNIITNPRNLGFARAVNQGLKRAQGKYWLLLNSDTILIPGSLDEMIKFMDMTPRLGILGAQLVNPNGSRQNSFDNFPDFWSTILNKNLLRFLSPGKYPSKNQERTAPFVVESVIGACIIVRPEAVRQVGWLDENYFVFLEETDWCYRMRRAGWRVMMHPTARIYHLQGETKRQFLVPGRIEYLNSLYKFLRKNTSRIHYLLVRICYPLKLLIELVFNTIGVIVTFGLVSAIRQRWYLGLNTLRWHMLGCPKEMTLEEFSKELTGKKSLSPIRWVYRDIYVDPKVLPTHLSPDNSPRGDGLEWEIIKEGRLKRIFRIRRTGETRFYLLKLYRDGHPFSCLKNLVSGPRYQRELSIARKSAYAGIPTIIPLAVGYNQTSHGIPKQQIILSPELENCCGLDIYLLAPEKTGFPYNLTLRRRVISAYGNISRRIHEKGIYQDDFDPNNMLVSFAPADPVRSKTPKSSASPPLAGWTSNGAEMTKTTPDFKLYLVDFERVKIRRKLTIRERAYNLASLNRLKKGISLTERFRFLKGYLNTDNKLILRTWVKKIKESQEAIWDEDYKWVGRMSLRVNRYIGYCEIDAIRGFYRRRYPIPNKSGFSVSEIEKLVREIMMAEDSSQGLILPFEKDDGSQITLKARFFPRYSEAKQFWQDLNAFLRIYVTGLLPVALLKTGWRTKRGVVIFESIGRRGYLPRFFTSKKIEERLTEIEKIGI